MSLDLAAARNAPGVALVLTGEDTREAGFHRTPALLPFTGRGGAPLIVPPRRALADDKVRYVGEPVLLVLADTLQRAMDAAELAIIEYDDLPVALRHEWVCDQGAYPVATGPLISTLNPSMMCTGCYRVPAVYGRHRLALTNTVPITAYRGAGRPDMAYVIERLVDAAARQTNPPEKYPWQRSDGVRPTSAPSKARRGARRTASACRTRRRWRR